MRLIDGTVRFGINNEEGWKCGFGRERGFVRVLCVQKEKRRKGKGRGNSKVKRQEEVGGIGGRA